MGGADHLLLEFVLVMFVALSVLFVFYWIKQPSVVAYIVAGVVAGPFGLGIITDAGLIETLGEFGVLMLLFFIGMEISISSLVKNWRVVILGTMFQVLGSITVIGILGHFFDWELSRIILLGFVTSLSSTAVILSYLESKGILGTRVGSDVVGVLLAQDILIVPMLITVSALGGSFDINTFLMQILGTLILLISLFILLRKKIALPKIIRSMNPTNDHKLFIALILCFGAALFTGIFQLSLGLGAFIGGVFAANVINFGWVKDELRSFKTLFLALFFVSIGLLIDMTFLKENLIFIIAVLMSAFVINTFVNTIIFLWLRRSLRYSLYVGAILAPLGEFSFLLATAGLQVGAIGLYAYQMAVIVIALSLIVSPFWTWAFRRYKST